MNKRPQRNVPGFKTATRYEQGLLSPARARRQNGEITIRSKEPLVLPSPMAKHQKNQMLKNAIVDPGMFVKR